MDILTYLVDTTQVFSQWRNMKDAVKPGNKMDVQFFRLSLEEEKKSNLFWRVE